MIERVKNHSCAWCTGDTGELSTMYRYNGDKHLKFCTISCLTDYARYQRNNERSVWLAILAGFIGLIVVTFTFGKAHALEWPKEITVHSVACIAEEDATIILLTQKHKDLASAQAQYQEFATQSLCLAGEYSGTFVSIAREVPGLVVEGDKYTGFVLEMDASGHQFFLLVLRKPDPEA